MRWRILPSARRQAQMRVQAILARNSGTYQPYVISFVDLMRYMGATPAEQIAPQAPAMH